ncbi:MAG: hypothetical protein ACYDCO_07495 [Armatimonadota bacterium]
MTRFRYALISVLLLAAAAGVTWAWLSWRTVDGRNASAWLAFTHQASQRVSYRANGHTTWQGTPATFSLTQGEQGRYVMRVTDARGQLCTLGHDGRFTWYQANAHTVRTAKTEAAPMPSHVRSRIVGTSTVAGRPSVTLRVRSGNLSKALSIDRETGVVLRMVTTDHQREVSRMDVQHITYEPVTVTPCPSDADTAMKPVTHPEVSTILGRQAVEPHWLPDGMTARGTFREWCNCCQTEMAVLRYADGVRTLTLFEGAGHHQCAMAEGCHMAPSGSAYIETRRVGQVTVTAVGDVDRETLAKVVRSLQ